MATSPRKPTAMRIRCGVPARGGMKSMTRTAPSAVTQSVSSTRVWPAYRRAVQVLAPAGARAQCPASWLCRRAANAAGESKRGRQSQSTDPAVLTSAAVCRSPSTA